MTNEEKWSQDLHWLLKHRYPGRGGQTALAEALTKQKMMAGDFTGVTSVSVHQWVHGKKAPSYENRRTLLLLRDRVAGEVAKGGRQYDCMD